MRLVGQQKWSVTRRALSDAQSSLTADRENGEAVGHVAVRVVRAKGP